MCKMHITNVDVDGNGYFSCASDTLFKALMISKENDVILAIATYVSKAYQIRKTFLLGNALRQHVNKNGTKF